VVRGHKNGNLLESQTKRQVKVGTNMVKGARGVGFVGGAEKTTYPSLNGRPIIVGISEGKIQG